MTDPLIVQQQEAWTDIASRFSFNETANGPGSTVWSTKEVREKLPRLMLEHDIETVLDAPCGDWNWMRLVDLDAVDYLGWDVVTSMVSYNIQRFSRPHNTVRFELKNILEVETWPQVDMIICRDFLIHLPDSTVLGLLNKFYASGSRYLLTTNHPHCTNDPDLPVGGHDGRPGYWHRPINLETAPFHLPGRVDWIEETSLQEMVLFDLHYGKDYV